MHLHPQPSYKGSTRRSQVHPDGGQPSSRWGSTFVGVGSCQDLALVPHDPFADDGDGGRGLPCPWGPLDEGELPPLINDLSWGWQGTSGLPMTTSRSKRHKAITILLNQHFQHMWIQKQVEKLAGTHSRGGGVQRGTLATAASWLPLRVCCVRDSGRDTHSSGAGRTARSSGWGCWTT